MINDHTTNKCARKKAQFSYKESISTTFTDGLHHTKTLIAQMADIGFKVVLLERLNQKWKQKHF